MAQQTRLDLTFEVSLAQQCVPSPTDGQGRRADQWDQRARQCVGRPHGRYISAATNSSMHAADVGSWSPRVLEVADTDKAVRQPWQVKPRFFLCRAVWDTWSGLCACSLLLGECALFVKRRHIHSFFQPSLTSTAKACSTSRPNQDPPTGIDDKR